MKNENWKSWKNAVEIVRKHSVEYSDNERENKELVESKMFEIIKTIKQKFRKIN